MHSESFVLSSEELSHLMAEAQDGCSDSYETLLRTIYPLLQRYFASKMRDGECDDLVQETLTTLHRARHTYDRLRPFLPWLFTLAHSRLVDHARRIKLHKSLDDLPTYNAESSTHLDSRIDASHDLHKILLLVSPQERRLLTWFHLDDMSIQEIATATTLTPTTVKVRIHRTLRRLREKIREKDSQTEV
jgi:RNA polymerase sigma-70 factor, ECF subfamily